MARLTPLIGTWRTEARSLTTWARRWPSGFRAPTPTSGASFVVHRVEVAMGGTEVRQLGPYDAEQEAVLTCAYDGVHGKIDQLARDGRRRRHLDVPRWPRPVARACTGFVSTTRKRRAPPSRWPIGSPDDRTVEVLRRHVDRRGKTRQEHHVVSGSWEASRHMPSPVVPLFHPHHHDRRQRDLLPRGGTHRRAGGAAASRLSVLVVSVSPLHGGALAADRPDLPGFGYSATPDPERFSYTLAGYGRSWAGSRMRSN
jgi:hypothetical protein